MLTSERVIYQYMLLNKIASLKKKFPFQIRSISDRNKYPAEVFEDTSAITKSYVSLKLVWYKGFYVKA